MTAGAAPRRQPVYGPEPWSELGGASWSHWDLWFSTIAVADHGGSLDQLEERLVRKLREPGDGTDRGALESKLSHLLNLRGRLIDAGLGPGDLANSTMLGERGLLAKARRKVDDQWCEGRAMTPAMIETPRVRLTRRARTGHWGAPVDPTRYYASFRRMVEVKDSISKNRSFAVVERVEERLHSLDRPRLGKAERLALHRALHTAGLELADRADDSYGNVGDMRRDAWHTYLRLDWRAAGMRPEDYWADLCDLVVFEDYALGYREETLPWSRLPIGHAEMVERLLLAVERECRTNHLDHAADEALQQLAWMAVAGRRFSRHVEVARSLGTDHWQVIEALAESALRSGRRELAVDIFRAADRPGRHQKRLRDRCVALTGTGVDREQSA